ncbi:MAG: hypothetical protein GY737_13840 [Desulfobacteraceae bacterium]|nr:hypothetical protein [Desulfobacteraceae bacterium]
MQGEWVRFGAVNVIQGSPLVIGHTTSWHYSGVIIGDFFIGPDCKIYEITGMYKTGQAGPKPIGSERITIRSLAGADEYEGNTETGGNYSIVRNWSNTTNSLIAAKIAELFKASAFDAGGAKTGVLGDVSFGMKGQAGELEYDISGFYAGHVPNGGTLLRVPFMREVTFSSSLGGATFEAGLTPEKNATLYIRKNSVPVASFQFAPGAASGTITAAAADVVCQAGDILEIVCQEDV